MSIIGDLWFGLHADTKTLQAEITKAGKVGGATFGSQMALSLKKSWSGGEMGKGLIQGLGLAGGLGAAHLLTTGITKVVDVLGDSIKAASDMGESMSKAGVVFGDSSSKIVEWSEKSATAIGLSKQAALEAAGTLGNLLLSMGKTSAEAATMSITMVNLAADLASFNNVDIEEVLMAMRSGLTGEIAPLRRFGVNLTDVTLKAKAMELGLYDGKGLMDASAKSAAAYALILEQTTTAQGDFERTSGGLANQQRALNAQMADLSAEVGERLLPFMVSLTKTMNDAVIPAVGDLVDALAGKPDSAAESMDVLGSRTTPLGKALHDLADSISGVLDETVGAGIKAKHAAEAVADVGPAIDEARHHVNRGTTAVGKLGTAFGESADDAVEARRRIISAAQQMVESLVGHARTLISDYFDVIENRQELAATNAELADLREIESKKKLTREQRNRLHELERLQAELILSLAEKGATSGKVYQTAINDLLNRLKTAHGKEKAMILGEIAALRALAAAAIVARSKVRAIDTGKHDPRRGGPEIRDSGGPTKDDTPYLIGLNRRPEIMVPGAGHILTQSQAAKALANQADSGNGNTYQFTLNYPDPSVAADDIGRTMRRLESLGF